MDRVARHILRASPKRRGETGSTAIELAVAAALLGMVLSLSIPSTRGYLAVRELQAWSESIVSDVRAAQQLAIARRATATVTFTPRTATLPATYATLVGGAMLRRQVLPPALDLTLATVMFNSLGARTPAGSAAVTITISHDRAGSTRTVTVAPVTGAVTVSEP